MSGAETVWCFQPGYENEKATIVVANMSVFQVTDVDTSKGTAFIKVGVWLRWTDPRLVNWGKRPLPNDLWTPRLIILQAKADMTVRTTEIHLENQQTGRIYTLTWYEGTISNHMDSLETFPFDFDSLKMNFYAAEMYTPEGAGNVNFKSDYRLLMDCSLWNLRSEIEAIPDWDYLGIKAKYIEPGHCQDVIEVQIVMKRKSMFYVWKVIAPLALTLFMARFAFAYENEDLANRMSHATTLLLSTFALVFVISSDLPKTDFLTKIDIVILLTMTLLVLDGLFFIAIYKLEQGGHHERAELWNHIACVGVPIVFVVMLLWQFVPTMIKRRWEENKTTQFAKSRGCDSKRWKVIDTATEVQTILHEEPNGRQLFGDVVTKAQKMKREHISDEEDRLMLAEASKKGIERLDIEHKHHAWTWSEYREHVEGMNYSLPTKEELQQAGVHVGKMDYWVPVSRLDGVEDDFAQIGYHPGNPGVRHFSHKDVFGPTQWQASPMPDTWRPAEYIYVKSNSHHGSASTGDPSRDQRAPLIAA